MKAMISGYHKSTTCEWCEKSNEAVTIEFERGFLKQSALCFRCLQQAIRVHHKQSTPTEKGSARADETP